MWRKLRQTNASAFSRASSVPTAADFWTLKPWSPPVMTYTTSSVQYCGLGKPLRSGWPSRVFNFALTLLINRLTHASKSVAFANASRWPRTNLIGTICLKWSRAFGAASNARSSSSCRKSRSEVFPGACRGYEKSTRLDTRAGEPFSIVVCWRVIVSSKRWTSSADGFALGNASWFSGSTS